MFYGSDHVIDTHVIYIYIYIYLSGCQSFLNSCPDLFSVHAILSTLKPRPLPFDPKKERGKIYFKADLFYAFV